MNISWMKDERRTLNDKGFAVKSRTVILLCILKETHIKSYPCFTGRIRKINPAERKKKPSNEENVYHDDA